MKTVHISQEDLKQVVDTVFILMVGLTANPDHWPDPLPGEHYRAHVDLSGSWEGSVILECGEAPANHLAARFLSLQSAGLQNDMVRDVLGEIVNMIGGNMKSALTSGVVISTPEVRLISEPWLNESSGVHQNFRCDEGPFWVTIHVGTAA